MKKYGTRVNGDKHQFYQFGFNAGNSCWLAGGWITVTKERYKKEAKEYEAKHQQILEHVAVQHHRDKGTPISKLTPEQRLAWEYYSGSDTVECVYDNGYCGPVGIALKADKPSESSIRWLKKRSMKVARRCKLGDREWEQKGFPADLYIEGVCVLPSYKFKAD